MRRICVFCGSSPGARPEYVEAARALGQVLAGRGIGLVYGGGRVGVMGGLADAVLDEQFVQAEQRAMLVIDENPEALLARFEAYQPPEADKATWALGLARR